MRAQSPPPSEEVTSEPIVGFAAHNDRCWKASLEPRSLIISCAPSKNIISTKTCNYAHTDTRSLHTLYHPCFRHQLSLLLNCLLSFCLLLSSLSLLPTTPMTLPASYPYSVFPACFHFLLSVYPSPYSRFRNYPLSQLPCFHFSYLCLPIPPLFFLLHLLLLPPAPLPPPRPKTDA